MKLLRHVLTSNYVFIGHHAIDLRKRREKKEQKRNNNKKKAQLEPCDEKYPINLNVCPARDCQNISTE
jgi:hypothetical protein